MSRARVSDLVIALLLAAWLGAVVFFGAVVAPAAFAALPSRTLAGAVVGRVLPTLFIAGLVAGGLVMLSGTRLRGAPRLTRLVAGSLVVASCAVAHFVIGSRIETVRASAGGALESLPEGDPARVTFGRLHGLSVAGLGIAALGAATALVFLVRPARVG